MTTVVRSLGVAPMTTVRRRPVQQAPVPLDVPKPRPALVLALLGSAALLTAGIVAGRRRSRLGARAGVRPRAPRNWFAKPAPKRRKLCYRRKTDALNVFRQENQALIDRWGGESLPSGPAEFDAINQRNDWRGKHAVTTIGDALWASLDEGPPYCLETIDVQVLNETSPGQHGRGFRLPDYVLNAQAAAEQARESEGQFVDEMEARGVRASCHTVRRRPSGAFAPKTGACARCGSTRTCQCRTAGGRFTVCPRNGAQPEQEIPF